MRTIGTVLLVLGVFATATWVHSALGQDTAKKRKGKITVSKETTYVTGPLDEDGYVDYVAALHERLSQDVTPGNNANVLLWKAMGPHPEGAKMPARFFRWLGVPAPPEEGPYFSDLFKYVKENTKIDVDKAAEVLSGQLEDARRRPWKAKDYPLLADWLKANEQPLGVAVAATRRPHYYSPLVPRGRSGLIGALLPGVQQCRGLAGALTARAMLRAGQGDFDGAWEDLLACHRLGRLVARGGTLIEFLVGVAINQIAADSELAFLAGTKPDARRAEAYLSDLQNLPPFPALADRVGLTERFVFLESVSAIARHGPGALQGFTDEQARDRDPRVAQRLAAVDWDPALRTGNRWFDRVVAALREPKRVDREKQLDQIEANLKALKTKLGDVAVADLLRDEKQTARTVGKALGDILITMLMPAFRKVQTAADRGRQVHDNLTIAFALEAYRRDKGGYPKTLDALAPRYLKQIPGDLFSGKALIYRPADGGYLFYSVGINGRDDGGRGYEDDPPGDDLSVRMPRPELRRP
jgi:hypothetical protein